MIKDNLDRIMKNIETAKAESRFDEDVKLLAVTKFRSNTEIREVYDWGLDEFGENRVQELLRKYDELSDLDIKWHLIGHLQRNKVKSIIGKVSLIHSVDSVRLMKEIAKQSVKAGTVTDILIEFNIGEEENKYGFRKEEASKAFDAAANMKGINVRGVMCMAPFIDDEETLSSIFSDLRKIYEKYGKEYGKYDNINLDIISMGMSNDYPIAIREGSNLVRVGTSIFKGE